MVIPRNLFSCFFLASLCVTLTVSGHSVAASDVEAPPVTTTLAENGVAGGVIVYVGRGVDHASLLSDDAFVAQVLDTDQERVDRARQQVFISEAQGRLTFRHWPGGALPYTDNLINALVWEEAAGAPDMSEIMRVLAPGGIAFIQQNDAWETRTKPRPEAMDAWTHFRYDAGGAGMSRDTLVGPPRRLQWEAGPRFMRSHEIETGLSCMVSDKGRIYYILDEGPIGITDARFPAKWSLLCRDGFNGALLWQRPLPDWGWQRWSGEARVNDPNTWLGLRTRGPGVERLMAAVDNTLFVTLGFGAPITAINGATGETLRRYDDTTGVLEFVVHQGIVIARQDGPKPVMALRASSGDILWQREESMCLERSLAAAGDRVFYHTRNELVAVALETGAELWRGKSEIRPNVVMATPETVLTAQTSVMKAFCVETGVELWEAPGVQRRGGYLDVFVGDGMVWSGNPEFTAREARTGDLTQQLSLQRVLETGHHWRCYANKATCRFLVTAVRGAEFLDLRDDAHTRHNWFRGPCLSGMMPANGLLYVPSHQCFCYPAVRMDGFFALATADEHSTSAAGEHPEERLETGPAYGDVQEARPIASDEWPMYRRDVKRSGSALFSMSAEVAEHWTATPGGNLTPPVAAYGRVFVAQKDAGAIVCLDLDTGATQWRRAVSGPIDSPPTLHKGRVIFGARSGWVYSLRAEDGEVDWRFRAAPQDQQLLSHGRLESPWPVHGSVIVFNDVVYCTAGRSGFLDGGIRLYGLAPETGAVVHTGELEGPWPDISQPSYAFHKDGYRADLLTTDGTYLYMGRTALDAELNEVDVERINLIGTQRGDRLEYRIMPGKRLVATGGFLNDTFWNRTWWMHTRVWPGFHYAQQAPKSGQLVVFDETAAYTVKHYVTRNRHSPMLFPGNGYLLFADDIDNEPLFYRGEGEPAPIPWEPELPEETRWTIYQDAAVDKGPGFTRAHPARWTAWVDVRVEAMTLAGDHLLIAGTPDVVPENDPLAAIEGRMGGMLRVIRTADGKNTTEYPLSSPPVFDGLIAANDRAILCTANGQVICLGKRGQELAARQE